MRRAPPLFLVFAACLPQYDFASPVEDGGIDSSSGTMDAQPAVGLDATVDVSSPPGDASVDAPRDAAVDAPGDAGEDAAPPVSLKDLVLLMHMDEPSWSGAGSVKDSSPQGNNGTPVGTANTTAVGKFGGAGKFDGSGYVDIPDAVSLHPTTALTYAAWIYPTDLLPANYPDADAFTYGGIFSKRAAFQDHVEFTMFLWTADQLCADLQGTTQAPRFWSTGAPFQNNHWYHVAIVYDGAASNATIYINGAPILPATSLDPSLSVPSPAPDLLLGYLNPGAGNPDPKAYYVGLIDEVAIWLRALSAQEISALAHATVPL
jgi:hypothetical protein